MAELRPALGVPAPAERVSGRLVLLLPEDAWLQDRRGGAEEAGTEQTAVWEVQTTRVSEADHLEVGELLSLFRSEESISDLERIPVSEQGPPTVEAPRESSQEAAILTAGNQAAAGWMIRAVSCPACYLGSRRDREQALRMTR